MSARAVSLFGGVDVIYANAGISGGYLPVTEQTVEQWQEVLRDQPRSGLSWRSSMWCRS
jgi:NAD(P)-dependent dehydrogenase (short-subunit alcohol dehydrogenase family)